MVKWSLPLFNKEIMRAKSLPLSVSKCLQAPFLPHNWGVDRKHLVSKDLMNLCSKHIYLKTVNSQYSWQQGPLKTNHHLSISANFILFFYIEEGWGWKSSWPGGLPLSWLCECCSRLDWDLQREDTLMIKNC